MSNTSEINVYYRREDIESYNTLNFTPLFSDLQFNNIIGGLNVATNLLQYYKGIELNTFYSGILYFYLDNNETKKKDSISAVLTTFNDSTKTILEPGFFIYQIIAGEGKYQGASGKVYIYNDEKLIRSVKIVVNY
jgi:hypothetical protein